MLYVIYITFIVLLKGEHMDKNIILFAVVITIICFILAGLLLLYAIKRKPIKQEIHDNHSKQNSMKLWKFLFVFGIFFSSVPTFILIYQITTTQSWVEVPAVISEIKDSGTGSQKEKHIFVSYEFNNQVFENIDTNTFIRQRSVKNPTTVGQEITVLINPNTPNQIMASQKLIYGVLFTLLAVGLLLCTLGGYQLLKSQSNSLLETTKKPNTELSEEEKRKNKIGMIIIYATFIGGFFLFVYIAFSFRAFLFFVCWFIFLAIYGLYKHYQNK